jgi:hypothetical protein
VHVTVISFEPQYPQFDPATAPDAPQDGQRNAVVF